MNQLPEISASVEASVLPTYKIYTKLLEANASKINSTAETRQTYSYGPHSRQELDIYTPENVSDTAPVLLWVHGGGFVMGDKRLSIIPGDLVYANVGHFFASQGFISIFINYRLVLKHDAVFPSGGEDVALAVEWITKHYAGQKKDLFGVGNSAGGVHWSTFLFHESFSKTLEKVTCGDGVRLRGITLQSAPFDFLKAGSSRQPVNEAYFGDDVEGRSPHGLMTSAGDSIWQLLTRGGVRINVVMFELDPIEIKEPVRRFVEAWNRRLPESGTQELVITEYEGHNHISPYVALGTGIEREEAWGFKIVEWMQAVRTG
ncbi:alpha/beta-hydrolase [Corynespora cassiicola Philippines]|uniref:Alpha/beta-hydrolase n=1 Tax=Corynespora cassiicola Philippines TaxID=1448308 RepID=A0A2T2N7Y5_CORCC|nr:alpha/beta-hydrolase [Corynespora cassiicola Philippines]